MYFGKKTKQIVITKSFKLLNPIPELVDFLENILNTSIPISIKVSIDFFGFWRSGKFYEDQLLFFVWASKATSMVSQQPANSRQEINKIKDKFNISLQFLYEDWVNTHLENAFCESSKVHADRITNALIFLEISDFHL